MFLRQIILALLLSSAMAQNPVCLFQPTNNLIPFWAFNTDTGDFNNDAIVDFISPAYGGFDLRLSNGWGIYSAPTSFSFSAFYTRLKSTDLNNDNNNDVIGLPAPDSNFVIIWRGNGAGSFTSVTTYSVNGPSELTIDDFNNDGNKDLAIINGALNAFSIHLGDGLGGFTFTTSYSLNNPHYGLTKGDFNNDGNKDLGICNNSSIKIFRGYGNGTFSLVTTINSAVINLESTDINNDNRSDLIAIDPTKTRLKVIKASSNFSFLPIQTYSITGTPSLYSFSYADFNNDSQKDIVAIDAYSLCSVFINNGSGNFTTQSVFSYTPGGMASIRVLASKMNQDNKPDLFIITDNSARLSVLLNCNTTGLFEKDQFEMNFRFFPNPADKKLNLHFNNLSSNSTCELINCSGQKVFESNISSSTLDFNIDLSEFPDGLYFLNLCNEDLQRLSKRLIISHF